MKKLYVLILLALVYCNARAQTYGNEWINFSSGGQYSDQQYFKIRIWKDGIYRISRIDLLNAGFNVNQNPQHFQVFHNGIEQFIYVQGESDGVFDQGDFIEFYGRKNDGAIDKSLYEDDYDQPFTYFSLINDTGTYFLTVNTGPTPNRRMSVETDVNFSGYSNSIYFKKDALHYIPNIYYDYSIDRFGLSLSSYTYGENYLSEPFTDNILSIAIPTPNAASNTPSKVDLSVAGTNFRNHNYTVSVNGTNYISDVFPYYFYRPHSFNIPQQLSATTNVELNALANPNPNEPNAMALGFINVNYPHQLSMQGETVGLYSLNAVADLSNQKTFFNISNVSAASLLIYMLSGDTLTKISYVKNGSTLQFLLPTNFSDKQTLVVDSSTQVYSGSAGINYKIVPVKSQTAPLGYFTNFSYNPNAEYLIITHPKLWTSASAYKNYRENNPYNSYSCLMADIEELYDQFAYGVRKHPLAVKGFVLNAIDNFITKPRHLFLIGKSVAPLESRMAYDDVCLVPTFGSPPSDLMLTARRTPLDTILKQIGRAHV